jgi:carboxymethylenebutenolidase
MYRTRIALALSLLSIAFVSAAQEHQHSAMATVTTSTTTVTKVLVGTSVNFTSSPGEGSGYLSLPSGAGKHPAIIVIQEWWGVDDWIKQQADRFASQGYVALAPDLYRGKVATDANLAHELMRGMPQDRAMNDLKGAFNFLAARKDVDAKHIGVIGWCMGGGYAIDLALAEPRLAAAVMNYGHTVTDPAAIAKLHPPLMGNFGGADRGIPPADVKAFEAALKAAGKSVDFKIYDGAGHAFMNPNNTGGYVEAAAKDAWSRIDAFFAHHLR